MATAERWLDYATDRIDTIVQICRHEFIELNTGL